MMLFCSSGSENPVHAVGVAVELNVASLNGHVMRSPAKVVVSNGVSCVLVTPADCGHDAVKLACTQLPAGALASGVPMLCVRTPEEASVSLLAMVLLMIFTFNESSSEIPAPSQPATLFTMMLLVTETLFQC